MKIGVILGSTRGVRRGERVSTWLMSQLTDCKDVEFELLDLKDYPLPFFVEPNSPDSLENGYSDEVATKWAQKVGEMDGFIIITPEYNHAPPAVLKNALDYVYNEWNRKPVAFVSYASGQAAGIRAVEQLRLIVIELQMVPVYKAIHMSNILSTIDENGNLLKGHYNEQVPKLVGEVVWWATALKIAREKI